MKRLHTNSKYTEKVKERGSNYCQSCESFDMSVFYEVKSVPVNSVIQIPSKEEAINFPKGDITLCFCHSCGFMSNISFDSKMTEYSDNYESTQSFSSTFTSFNRELASRLIEKYNLKGKDIIEIGCGNGEFLSLLCDLGRNRGIGFDPAFTEGRTHTSLPGQIKFIKDFYSEKYSGYRGDIIICKMTLEHIENTAHFVGTIRRSVTDYPDTIVFFQVPNAALIVRERAFWDIYYEHCSYFSAGSLCRLFESCSFDVVDLWSDYDDQYLMIAAKPGDGKRRLSHAIEETPYELKKEVDIFSNSVPVKLNEWGEYLRENRKNGRKAVLWGGGSKGVAFLSTLGIYDEIQFAVDINPHKEGKFMAGTGQRIVSPSYLRDYKPDIVIVMNPIYRCEIREELARLRLDPVIKTV